MTLVRWLGKSKLRLTVWFVLVWDGLHEQIGEERLGKRSPLMTRQINGNGTVPRTNGNGSGSGSAASTPSTGSPSDITEEEITKVSQSKI